MLSNSLTTLHAQLQVLQLTQAEIESKHAALQKQYVENLENQRALSQTLALLSQLNLEAQGLDNEKD